jgi:hypothetical protein
MNLAANFFKLESIRCLARRHHFVVKNREGFFFLAADAFEHSSTIFDCDLRTNADGMLAKQRIHMKYASKYTECSPLHKPSMSHVPRIIIPDPRVAFQINSTTVCLAYALAVAK